MPSSPSQADQAIHSAARLPPNEEDRLEALYAYGLIDTLAEDGYDDFTLLAAMVCGAKMATVSLVDRQRQWFVSRLNVALANAPRDSSFCAHAILEPHGVFEIPDTMLDERFANHPVMLNGEVVRFYAGWPLVDPDGHALGTLCVMDHQPMQLSVDQRRGLEALGRRLMTQMRLGLQLNVTNKQNVTDALTGVANRRAFDAKINVEWEQHMRFERELALIVFDVDKFKSFNDEFGHKMGDNILMQVAASVTSVLRRADFFARYGGEEFAIILEGTNEAGALIVAEKIRKTIEFFPWSPRPITISAGICVLLPSDPLSPNQMVVNADAAMYEAKRAGRNQVCVWNRAP